MVESYKRQTMKSAPISLDSHGAGAICCPAALSSTPVTVLHYVDSALPGNKLPTAGRFQEVLTGPSTLAAYYGDKTVLVTGARGYIGAALVEALASVANRVILVDRTTANSWMPTDPTAVIQEVYGDLAQMEMWNRMLPGVDVIFHLAAKEYAYRDREDPEADLLANVIPGLRLLESCRINGFRPRIIFTSSANLYGKARSLPVSEQHPSNPLTLWGAHKLLLEQYLRIYSQRHGIASVSLRLANVFGPTPRSEVSNRVVVNRVIERALVNYSLVTYKNRDCIRDIIYIDDVIQALLLSGANTDGEPGSCFVIGSGEGHTIETIWKRIAEAVGSACGRDIIVSRDNEAILADLEYRNFVADTSLFRERTGWIPKTGLEEGLTLTVNAMVPA